MRKSAIYCLLAAGLLVAASARAGVIISGTRLIYHGENKEASVQVMSGAEDKYPYLIQSFVDGNGPVGDAPQTAGKLPFTVTPPLFRLEPGAENTIRVVRTGGDFPADRETVYWLDVKAIPARKPEDEGKNILRFSLKNRIKLFYRPVGLADPTADDFKAITFRRSGHSLVVTNPTAWYLTFFNLTVGGHPVDTRFTMVAPHGVHEYPLPAGAAGNITWQYINDYGAASPVLTGRE
ncbi:TPA: molecular chaperone [Klebsiella pneumoniae]|uniref:fimbrial biogenesis chaperone n=1 Tax=Klebsiella pneumoniae TaxID=573 RepID=UPI000AD63ACF|nr:molecular chaperone [Klebsiella pneumoniae]MCI7951836.1 molecular chaperone [Klebsiella pneumoniae]MDU4371900.1 molecular chaperone [Klebsiella pneumoniae]MDW5940736.1 molecular chaperone [Klebsiella pneumoniae]MDW6114973.1 molecular chaperone [Klebsiella pneumoniae]HBQ8098963.1 molecular chaperone [Klebsiella pneumoniae]